MKCKEKVWEDVAEFFAHFFMINLSIPLNRVEFSQGSDAMLAPDHVLIEVYFGANFVVSLTCFSKLPWAVVMDFEYMREEDELKMSFLCKKNVDNSIWK